MAQASDFDIGPLTWIKGEIEQALAHAAEALEAYAANPLDSTRLKFCKNHLHQAHGALEIVGLEGVTRLTEEAERLIDALDEGTLTLTPACTQALQGAFTSLKTYLDELVEGVPHRPLRLFPAYRAVMEVRGAERIQEAELFFPDLSVRPPRREAPELPADMREFVLGQRRRFQTHLLRWLRNAADNGALREMGEAVRAIERTQALPQHRAFWWVTIGFVDALVAVGAQAGMEAKRLCARIDLQMKRLMEGSPNVAERLLRDTLYFVARTRVETPAVLEIRRRYDLDDALPSEADGRDVRPLEADLRALREIIGVAKDKWNRFSSGHPHELGGFGEQVLQLKERAAALGNADFSMLAGVIASVAAWIGGRPERVTEAVALETATALLLAENAIETFARLSPEFPQQVVAMGARLKAGLDGVASDVPAPLLDEMTRRAQERLVMAQLVSEIKANLAAIEGALDGFFRDSGKRAELAPLDGQVKQVLGALTMLGADRAVEALSRCRDDIARFADPDYQPVDADFERVAQVMSGLGFYVEAMRHGPADFDALMQPVRPRQAPLPEEETAPLPVPVADEAVPVDEHAASLTVEAELEAQRKDARTLFEAWRDKPGDDILAAELKANLAAIRQDADLVDAPELIENANRALELLDRSEHTDTSIEGIEAAMAAVAPAIPEPEAPSAEVTALAASSDEVVDAELLAIFLEEARDVLGAIAAKRDVAEATPGDHDALTVIRRGFHTLKGSGRMVGLTRLGEAAWAVEQVMNLWLQEERAASADLLAMVASAHGLFSQWIADLSEKGGSAVDASALISGCDALREGRPFTLASPAGATAEEPAPSPERSIVIGDMRVSPGLYNIFIEEAGSHLAAMQAGISELAGEPQVPPESLVRSAHTLAGIAGTVNFRRLHELARAFERALLAARGADAVPTMADIELFYGVVEAIEVMVGAVRALQVPPDFSELDARLEARRAEWLAAVGGHPAGMTADAPGAMPALAEPDAGEPVDLVLDMSLEEPNAKLDNAFPPLPGAPEVDFDLAGEEAQAESGGGLPTIDLDMSLDLADAVGGDDSGLMDIALEGEAPQVPVPPPAIDIAFEDAPASEVTLPQGAAIDLGEQGMASPADDVLMPGNMPADAGGVEVAAAAPLLSEVPMSFDDASAGALPGMSAVDFDFGDDSAPEPGTIGTAASESAAPEASAPEFAGDGSLHLTAPDIAAKALPVSDASPTLESIGEPVGSTLTVGPDAPMAHVDLALEDAPAFDVADLQADTAAVAEHLPVPDIELVDTVTAMPAAPIEVDAGPPEASAPLEPESAFEPELPAPAEPERAAGESVEASADIEVPLVAGPTAEVVREAGAASESGSAALAAGAAATLVGAGGLAALLHAGSEPEEPREADAPRFAFAAVPGGPQEGAPAAEAGVTADADALSDADLRARGFDPADRRLERIADEIDPQLLPIFLEEAGELLPLLGQQLRAWSASPQSSALSQGLQRTLHTFKGSARMAGAMAIGQLSHSMEARIENALGLPVIPGTIFEGLFASCDRLSVLLDGLRDGEVAPEVSAPAPREDEATFRQDDAGAAEAAPAEPFASAAFDTDARSPEPAAASGAKPPAPRPAPVLPAAPDDAARPMLRVRADLVDRLVNEAGEVAIARSRIEGELRAVKSSLKELTDSVTRLRNQLREIEIAAETQMQSRQREAEERHETFDPLEFDRFTRFQEITRMMAESVNDVATVQQNLLKNVDDTDLAILSQARLNRDLQGDLMRVRMVPFNTVAERLYRVVRQTAKELGKRANLDIRGVQTEIDRSVLERMTAPFEHLLRNAIAHGIEAPQSREAAGKSGIGQIALTARQEGNEFILIFEDDGGGLDLARIRARAREAGLMRADEVLNDAQVAEFIFMPGFTTASEVSAVAGRGVGMDVVRSEVAALGGRIDTESVPGSGTRFTISLPLTLAVTQVVLVRAGHHLFAVPSVMVEQVRQTRAGDLNAAYEAGLMRWQERDYPIHFLPRLLGDPQMQPQAQKHTPVLLVRSGTQRAAIHVDELVGNQEVVVKNIGPQLARVTGIAGATVLGNGQIVLMLNPVPLALMAGATVRQNPDSAQAAPAERLLPAPAPLVMVVDDSLTVRKITSRLLARENYQVLTARDGVDALEQLQDLTPDIMLVDIEMPRMDGFDLTRNVRADARLRGTPVIMISSRTADKHKKYAMELGVDVFLGKPYQEDELLKNITRLLKRAKAAV